MEHNEPNEFSKGEPEVRLTPEQIEKIATFFDEQVKEWEDHPEERHPYADEILSSYADIEHGNQVILNDAREVIDSLRQISAEVRAGNLTAAKQDLKAFARYCPEALELLKMIDPEAKRDRRIDDDKEGNPVLVGVVYRWTPEFDNQRNESGVYKIGRVVQVDRKYGTASALWKTIGEYNPEWEKGDEEIRTPDEFEKSVPTSMLSPVEESDETADL